MTTTGRGEVTTVKLLQGPASPGTDVVRTRRLTAAPCAASTAWTGTGAVPSQVTTGEQTASGSVNRGFAHLGANGRMDDTTIALRRLQETPT